MSSIYSGEQGFTLIEVLVYMALVAFIIGGTLLAVFQIIQASSVAAKDLTLESEANFLLRKLSWAFNGDVIINLPATGSLGSVLSLTKIDYANNPVVFDISGHSIRIKEGICAGCIFHELNSDYVNVASLSFEHLSAVNGRPEGARVSFKLNNKPFEFLKYFR